MFKGCDRIDFKYKQMKKRYIIKMACDPIDFKTSYT